jgi:hypothetical protein
MTIFTLKHSVYNYQISVKLVYLLSISFIFYACVANETELNSQAPDYGFPSIEQEQVMTSLPAINQMVVNDQSANYSDLTGYWIMKHITYRSSMLPVLLEEVSTRIEATLLIRIEQNQEKLIFHESVCDVFMFNEPSYGQTIIPDSFIHSLPDRIRKAQLIYVQDDIETKTWLSMQSEIYQEQRGILLNDFETEIPVDPNDHRIIDADTDGNPGLTVNLIGFPAGDVYLVQKMWDRFIASTVEENLIEGIIEWGDEQVFLGATNDALLVEVDRWIPQPMNLHQFTMQRVESSKCPNRLPPPTVD